MKRSLVLALLLVACSSPAGSSSVVSGADPTPAAEPAASVSPSTTEATNVVAPPTTDEVSSTVTPTRPSGEYVCSVSSVEPASGPIEFVDATEEFGLVEPLTGMYGHAAAFGDIDRDPFPDLFVGTFGDREVEDYAVRGADGPNPDRLLRGGAPFTLDESFPGELGRTSGAVFADFDGDGDSDLLLIRNDDEEPPPGVLLENTGAGFVVAGHPLPELFNGRTPAVADFDGDGLLDVFVSEDRYGETGGVLLKGIGGLEFEDVTEGSGLEEVYSLGAVAGDLDRDGQPDLATSDRIFLGNGDLTFDEITPDGYEWEQIGPDDDPAGVAVGDYDNDGWPDIAVGQHFRSVVEEGAAVPVRLFHNGGEAAPAEFEEVTEDVGLVPLDTLAPHVEFADVDNDGWLDLVTSGSLGEGAAPIVFRNEGGTFGSITQPDVPHYWVGAPVVDVDADGRLDVFGLEWEPSLPSRFLLNTTAAGRSVTVAVDDSVGGVGSVVEVSSPDGQLVGWREIGVASGYSSGKPAIAHIGVGTLDEVTITITTRAGESAVLEAVPAGSFVRWPSC